MSIPRVITKALLVATHHIALSVITLLVIIFPTDASSQSWGFSAGMSYVVPEEWGLAYNASGRILRHKSEHLQYGLAVTSEFWHPVSQFPSDELCSCVWESSGSAWLFELGPLIRVFAPSPKSDKLRLFWQGGTGAVFVSSDAEIIVHSVVPSIEDTSREMIGSQTAAYAESGLGIHMPLGKQYVEFLIMFRAIIADPEAAFSVSFTLGLNF